MKSPKNKYAATITYNTPIEGIGSATTVTANTEKEVISMAEDAYRNNLDAGKGANIVVRENQKEYPEFEWKEIKNYSVKA